MQEGHFTYFKWKGINSWKEMLTELLELLEQWEPKAMEFKNLFHSHNPGRRNIGLGSPYGDLCYFSQYPHAYWQYSITKWNDILTHDSRVLLARRNSRRRI